MRARVRRIRARTVFLMAMILYALVGLLIGGTLYVLNDVLRLVPVAERTWLDQIGAWILVLFPAAYGFLGGFFGAVAAIFYNAIAAIMGGVEVDLRVKDWGAGPPRVERTPAVTAEETRDLDEADAPGKGHVAAGNGHAIAGNGHEAGGNGHATGGGGHAAGSGETGSATEAEPKSAPTLELEERPLEPAEERALEPQATEVE